MLHCGFPASPKVLTKNIMCVTCPTLQVQVPLEGMDFGAQRQLVIGLGLLMSYEHMGYALVACLEGCTCPPKEFNLLHTFRISMT